MLHFVDQYLSTLATTFPQSVTDMFYELTHNGREHSWIDTKCHLCFVDFASIDGDLNFAIVHSNNVASVWSKYAFHIACPLLLTF